MKILSEEKSKLIAERNGWTLAFAEGHVAGESMRRSGKVLSMYALVGIDDYALGFRAGYFQRQSERTIAIESRPTRSWSPDGMPANHAELTQDTSELQQTVAR
jgi:hypothetical protein